MQDPSRSYVGARRELALELVHATEAAALAAAHLLGRGDEERVHEVAGEAMRKVLEESPLSGMVALGSRNESILPPGTSLPGAEAPLDFGLFPVEGAGQVARGYANAVSIVAAVDRGGFAQLPAVWYAEKIVAGPASRGAVDLDDSVADNLRRIAFARDARVQDLTVAVLDRPRHQELIAEVAATDHSAGRKKSLMAGAQHDCAGQTGLLEDRPHGVDGRLRHSLRIAPPKERGARECSSLGSVHELKGELATRADIAS